MKRFAVLMMLTLAPAVFADELDLICSKELGASSQLFLEELLGKKVLYGYRDGDIHGLAVRKNQLGFFTGRYTFESGEGPSDYGPGDVIYSPMTLLECVNRADGVTYIQAYKNKWSPAGTFKYEAFILLPVDRALLTGKSLGSIADPRLGYWEPVIVELQK